MPRSGRPSARFRESLRYFAAPHRPPNAGHLFVYEWGVYDRATGETLRTFKFEEDARLYAADLHNGLIARPQTSSDNPFNAFEPDLKVE